MPRDPMIDLALLLLRLSVAWVFLYAAWKNTENKEAWTWTRGETALLFRDFAEPARTQYATAAAIAGMVMMFGGGISVLLGLEPRLGGAAIATFSILGMRIHAIRRDEAKAAGEGGNAMGWSAYGAHVAAGLKNWALAGAGVALVLLGAGSYGLEIDAAARLVSPLIR